MRRFSPFTKTRFIVLLLVLVLLLFVDWSETREDNAELKEQLQTTAVVHEQEMNALKSGHAVGVAWLKLEHKRELVASDRAYAAAFEEFRRRYEARIIEIKNTLDTQREIAFVTHQAAMKEQIFLNEGIFVVGSSFLFLKGIDGEWEFFLPSGGRVVLFQKTNGSLIEQTIKFHR